MTLRAIGPLNGQFPEPTGMVVGFLRDPKTMPYLKYTQLVPAPEIQFMWFRMDPDEATRLQALETYAWAYDDYRPTGKGYTLKGEWIDSSTQRWDFPYTIGEATLRIWRKNGVDPKMLYDKQRANHAALHRAVRVITALTGASWDSNNTSALNDLLDTTDTYYDQSSGEQYLGGAPNDSFQIIKRSFQAVHKRLHKATNGAVHGSEHIAVLPPTVAEKIAISGEMVEFLKQSQYATRITDLENWEKWGLPEFYGGFKLVVEDTVRTFINQKADGTVADVTQSDEKDYILTDDSIYFVSRSGGLDGGYGFKSYSTIQCYHFGGEARVEAFTEPKHELVEGHVVMEDRVVTPALLAGFELTDVLDPG